MLISSTKALDSTHIVFDQSMTRWYLSWRAFGQDRKPLVEDIPTIPKDLEDQVDKVTRECESQPDDEIAKEVLKAFPDLRSRPSIYGFSNLEENNHLCNTKFMLIIALCCTITLRPNWYK